MALAVYLFLSLGGKLFPSYQAFINVLSEADAQAPALYNQVVVFGH